MSLVYKLKRRDRAPIWRAIAGICIFQKGEGVLRRLVRLAAAGAILLVGSAFLTACSTPPQHDIALVGSFTTGGVMGALSGQYAGNPSGGGKGGHFNPNLDTVHNVPAVLASGTYPIPNEGSCP